MNLRNPLPGYEPHTKPFTIDPAHSERLVTELEAAGFVPAGSCTTAEPETTAQMIQKIEGHSRNGLPTNQLIGPLVLNNELRTGNVIGLWKPKP